MRGQKPLHMSKPINFLLLFLHFAALNTSRGGLNNTFEAMGQKVQKAATDAASKAVADAAAKEMQKQMGNIMSGGFKRK